MSDVTDVICDKCLCLKFKLAKAFPNLVKEIKCARDGNPCSHWNYKDEAIHLESPTLL